MSFGGLGGLVTLRNLRMVKIKRKTAKTTTADIFPPQRSEPPRSNYKSYLSYLFILSLTFGKIHLFNAIDIIDNIIISMPIIVITSSILIALDKNRWLHRPTNWLLGG